MMRKNFLSPTLKLANQIIWERGMASKRRQYPPQRKRVIVGGTKRPAIHNVPKTANKELTTQKGIPPISLISTASPYVYVASCIFDDEEMQEDPKEMFTEASIPMNFRRGVFEFASPKSLNFELPTSQCPEVVIMGRSNVGKSSLLNAIMRKPLALSSKSPGRTQTVHYYGLVPNNDKKSSPAQAYLVDLPGYGYAQAPGKIVEQWQKSTQKFLLSRRDNGTLVNSYILVDSRRGASQFDRDVMGWLDQAEIPYSVVLTKSDRVAPSQIIRYANESCLRFHFQKSEGKGMQNPVVYVTSSSKKTGIYELMAAIDIDFTQFYSQGGIVKEESLEDD
jgi:GTP-binding protein